MRRKIFLTQDAQAVTVYCNCVCISLRDLYLRTLC